MASAPPVPRCVVARGAREAQAWLGAQLERDAARLRDDLRLCARPLRVVVPAGSLRENLLDRLVRARGGALVGVAVQTLWSVALEILDAAGERVDTGGALFELAVRRAVLDERELAAQLGELEDGAGLASAAVSDLLSARLIETPARQVEAALARLPRRERERATALVRSARATAATLERCGRARHAEIYAAAARALCAHPERLPTRALVLHGFASATGQARELLAALARRAESTWLVIEPGPHAGVARELAQRALGLELHGEPTPAQPTAELSAFSAWGEDDELREVAVRIRAQLDAGTAPESIAVVARSLDSRAVALRRHFEAAGVPWSGGREPFGLAPAARRLVAALEVLRDAGQAGADRWLDALALGAGRAREDVRCALRGAGIVRLAELARIDQAPWVSGRASVQLPQRGAVAEGGDDPTRPRRRELATEELCRSAQRARAALESLAAWPERAPIADQRAALTRFAASLDLLGESASAKLWDEIQGPLEELGELEPGVTRAELARLLLVALESATPELGGAGAGVRVLDAQAARGACFEELFVLGLERGAFPRASRSEALLGEAARRSLGECLSELVHGEGQEAEERWLFESVLDSAPRVTLSWRHAGDDGREIACSPLVERLLAERGVAAVKLAHRRDELFATAPLDAREQALATALVAPRAELEAGLAAAFEEAVERFGPGFLAEGTQPRDLARARLEILDELEPDRSTQAGRALSTLPGPWLGAAGPGALDVAQGLFVTGLESLARCPWQAFLERGLGLEPAPDPLADLPDLDQQMLGNAVHNALQLLLEDRAQKSSDLNAALAREPRSVAPPAPEAVTRALQAGALRALETAGLRLPGLVTALASRARPAVEHALDWLGPDLQVVAVEVSGATPAGLLFRADLVRVGEFGPQLIDFKTGKPLSVRKRATTRRKHLIARVEAGTALQAMAYAQSVDQARGAYLYLGADVDPDCALVEVEADDSELAPLFDEVVVRLEDAWRHGVVPPRPEHPDSKPNKACGYCAVSSACLRDDSGVRARLRDVAVAAALDGTDDSLAGRMGGLWVLGRELGEEDDA